MTPPGRMYLLAVLVGVASLRVCLKAMPAFWGALLALGSGGLVVFLCAPSPAPGWLERTLPARLLRTAPWGLLLLLVVWVSWLYPRLNCQRPGCGSDRDDALVLAVTRLLEGASPYAVRTYLNNEISPLPGSLMFAVPFVLLKQVAWQSLAALALSLFALSRRLKLQQSPFFEARTLLSLLALCCVPAGMADVLTGGDLFSCGLWFSFALILIADVGDRPLPAIFAGCVLALALFTRPTFCLALPLVLPLARRLSSRNRWLFFGATGLLSGLFLVFVWQTSSAGTGPQHLLSRAEGAVGWGVAFGAGLSAFALALVPVRQAAPQLLSALLWRAGWVTAAPLIVGALVLWPSAPRKSLYCLSLLIGSAPLWIYGVILQSKEGAHGLPRDGG